MPTLHPRFPSVKRSLLSKGLALGCRILAIAMVLGIAGCEPSNGGPATDSPTASAAQPARKSDDEAISARVKARLAADSELLPLPITVEIEHGTVTLKGSVPAAQIERAGHIVGRVDGVRSVDNRLTPAGTS